MIVLVSSILGLQSRQSPTVLGNIHAFSAQMALTRLSRYFVIKIVDDNGRSAFIGIGFSDRSDSFDLNVALQDHFKGVTKEAEIAKASLLGKIRTKKYFFQKPSQEDVGSKPQLDLAFKEGQTIKVRRIHLLTAEVEPTLFSGQHKHSKK